MIAYCVVSGKKTSPADIAARFDVPKKNCFVVCKNTHSIASSYNVITQHIQSTVSGFKYVVFVHDDVVPLYRESVLLDAFNRFDVVGVAGASSIKRTSPALWHILAGNANPNKTNMHGAVTHPVPNQSTVYTTSFGTMPARCVVLDGCFIACKIDVLQNVSWDETNPARFHFYDLDFSLQCHKMGYRVGVDNIPIVHNSPGLRKPDEEFKRGEVWFCNKWMKGQ